MSIFSSHFVPFVVYFSRIAFFVFIQISHDAPRDRLRHIHCEHMRLKRHWWRTKTNEPKPSINFILIMISAYGTGNQTSADRKNFSGRQFHIEFYSKWRQISMLAVHFRFPKTRDKKKVFKIRMKMNMFAYAKKFFCLIFCLLNVCNWNFITYFCWLIAHGINNEVFWPNQVKPVCVSKAELNRLWLYFCDGVLRQRR